MHKYSAPLLYFVEAPLAAFTALQLLGYDATSLAHLYLGSFSHSLQILSSSVRLNGERCCTAIFRSPQRCYIGFKSGLWLGHLRTFRDLSRSHSCAVLAVCLGPLSCWKVNLHPAWGPERIREGFHQESLCTLLRSSFPRSWLVSQSLKNLPTAWCFHHHASP